MIEINKTHNIDVLAGLKMLPDESIDCIVTSPPYWQLRDYNLEKVLWGGSETCEHQFDEFNLCKKCNGWLGQLGLEPTRDNYIAHLCIVFDECRRVLKKTGTMWVNLGDSYSKSYKSSVLQQKCYHSKNRHSLETLKVNKRFHHIASKSLCNVPNRFAEEMILRGWILRNEIIWHKPSCIPSAAKNRFTVDFEKMFFFTKSTKYYFKQQFEPYAHSTFGRYKYPMTSNKCGTFQKISGRPKGMMKINPEGRNRRCVWSINVSNSREKHNAMFPEQLVSIPILSGCPDGGLVLDPFMGSGTTACVAKKLGRNFIGLELSAEYIKICEKRCS